MAGMGRGPARLLRDRQTALAAMLAFWTTVGLVTALQDIAAARIAGGAVSAADRLGRGLEAGLLWVPLTLLVVALHGRFRLEGAGWRRSVAVHVAGCLAVPLLYNLLYWLVRAPELPLDALGRTAVRDWLAHLHLAGAVYWAIVLVDRLRRAPDGGSRPASGRTTAGNGTPGPAFVAVRSGPRVHAVAAGRIAWIEGAGDYARLHAEDGTFLASRTLAELARQLGPEGFLRIHRSTIVNLRRVRRFRPLGHGDYRVTLDDGTELRVSRGRGREFRRRMAGRGDVDPVATP